MRKSPRKTSTTVFNESDRVLIRILAEGDAVWLPPRTWQMPIQQNIYEGRALFRLAGIPWSSAATTEQGRKAAQRQIETLADEGRVIVCRPTSHRAVCVRLTDQTEAATRAMAGLPGMCGAYLAMKELARLAGDSGIWVSEFSLMKNTTDKFEAMGIENMLLPALTREWVISNATINGEVRYSITPAGASWLSEAKEPTDHPDKENTEAAAAYDAYIISALNKFETLKPKSTREMGLLPLPASHEKCSLPTFRRK